MSTPKHILKPVLKWCAAMIAPFVALALVLTILIVFDRPDPNYTYTSVINKNWALDLPREDEEIYYDDTSGSSLHNDGERYFIAKYTDKAKQEELLRALDWGQGPDEQTEEGVKEILRRAEDSYQEDPIKIDSKYALDFSKLRAYKYWNHIEYDDSGTNMVSGIFIIYDETSNTMYTVETFS